MAIVPAIPGRRAAAAAKPVIITCKPIQRRGTLPRRRIPLAPSTFALAAATTRLRAPDLVLVAVYLVGITLFGLRFRKGKGAAPADKSLKSYFLAGNTIPWWAIALSIVSAETSTLTIISIPGVAFAGDFGFLQIVLGYMLGRIVVAALFLPRYFAGEMLTAYQLIDRRFGRVLHKVTAGLFLLTRAAAEGVRVFAVSIVVGIAIGTKDVLSIAIISALTLLYTFEGGMAAVIWTDVVQMAIYVFGTLVAVWSLGAHIPGGWATIHTVAGAAGKFHIFNFALNLTTTYTFWAGVLGGTFLTMASHGTDQLMVQRLLAARSLRESRLALLSSGVVIFIQFALFLLIGVGLYVFYGPPLEAATATGVWHWAAHLLPVGTTSDRIFPTFIVREMPLGVAGLLVAAILAAAMSNLSAALNSLSSTTVVDFYIELRPTADDRERAIISKSSTVLWALVLFAIAVYSISAGGKGHVVEIGLSIASVAYGCLLGVFLLGTLTKFATEIGATIGMVCGFALNLWLWQGDFPVHLGPLAIPHIAWTWYVILGALVTFAIGALASLLFCKQSNRTVVAMLALATTSVILSGASRPCDAQSKDPGTPRSADTVAPLPANASRYPEPLGSGLTASMKEPGLQPLGYAVPSRAINTPDFTSVSTLITDAIAAHKLPGAVVVIGHNGKVVFHHAYGDRKLAGEPGPSLTGPDGKPSPAEPMTEDTIFDMASLTKCLATATAIMQLYEQGKIASFDDPVAKYLPEFLNSPGTHPTAASAGDPSANTATAPSANGAATSQPSPKGWVRGQERAQRAESPTQNSGAFDKSRVTIRMLLTHTSGEAPDVSLKDAWGLAAPDRAEGFRRALTTPLAGAPGAKFVYSDINFILLGDIIETLSGQTEDVYAAEHIFKPLGMTETRYLPLNKACGPDLLVVGAAMTLDERRPKGAGADFSCPSGSWSPDDLLPRIAPTTHDDEGNAQTNPHFDMLTRGTVHDPTTRRMGGVAGHAGVFSTAHDISLYAQALLDKLLHNTGPFPLKQSTLQLMTQPEQPDPTHPGAPGPDLRTRATAELAAANKAEAAEIAAGDKPAAPGLAPAYPAIKGKDLRGYGWDIDTAFSKPRGVVFPIGSFGHTGFTGTTLWMDAASDTYIVLLSNAIHPRGNPPISNLRGQVATAAAQALGLSKTAASRYPEPSGSGLTSGKKDEGLQPLGYALADSGNTLTGIDVLESTNFHALEGLHHLGLLTNQSGIDAHGKRTVDILHSLTTENRQLTTLFSPEHGLSGTHDTETFAAETDPATGLHVISLYGAHDADRRPTHAQLAPLDAVVIDLQDAGVRTYTYPAVTGYFLEAAAKEKSDFHHDLAIVILDRPNLIDGSDVQGPVSDPGHEGSYSDYMRLPLRHGLTLGEFAQYVKAEKHLDARLIVVPMQHWSRSEYMDQTGFPADGRWINPSPNLRNQTAAILLPALTLLETTNVSVGRGTALPFELFGAGIPTSNKSPGGPFIAPAAGAMSGVNGAKPASNSAWFHAADVAAALKARHIPGVTFEPTSAQVDDDPIHPYHGQTIQAVRIRVTDRTALDSPELDIEILSALHTLYPSDFKLAKAATFLASQSTLDALSRGDDPRAIAAGWQPALAAFRAASAPYLLYR